MRLESLDSTLFLGKIVGSNRRTTLHPGTTLGIAETRARGSIRVVSVDGQSVSSNPRGTFNPPGVGIGTTDPVTFAISATNVPLDATVTLYLYSDSQLLAPVTAEPLQGTVGASTTTASATLPDGFSRGVVAATWVVP